jgi:TrpR-related protein YerC/YecD
MKYYELKLLSQNLQTAFFSLQSTDEVFNFLRDLMTETEIIDFTQRLDIAKRLYQGESYSHIEHVTGVSSTTIARVGKFLNGEFGGYKIVLKRLIS